MSKQQRQQHYRCHDHRHHHHHHHHQRHQDDNEAARACCANRSTGRSTWREGPPEAAIFSYTRKYTRNVRLYRHTFGLKSAKRQVIDATKQLGVRGARARRRPQFFSYTRKYTRNVRLYRHTFGLKSAKRQVIDATKQLGMKVSSNRAKKGASNGENHPKKTIDCDETDTMPAPFSSLRRKLVQSLKNGCAASRTRLPADWYADRNPDKVSAPAQHFITSTTATTETRRKRPPCVLLRVRFSRGRPGRGTAKAGPTLASVLAYIRRRTFWRSTLSDTPVSFAGKGLSSSVGLLSPPPHLQTGSG